MTDMMSWFDPESAWLAKADRAKHHIDDLAAKVQEFLAGSFGVVPEQGNRPGETIYRVQMSKPIPIHFSTMIGDVLHNLRSALDCAACEMARRTIGRDLTEQEEHACEFPIRSKPSELRKFFQHCMRADLYGPQERQAIRAVQPARLHDYLTETGQIPAHKRTEEVAYDFLTVLNRLSNIDKHRRLHVVTCWPDLVYWGSDDPSKRRWAWGALPLKNGSILGHLYTDPEHPEPPPSLHHEMELRIPDPLGAASMDVVDLLGEIHRDVTVRVLPRLLGPQLASRVGEPMYTDDERPDTT